MKPGDIGRVFVSGNAYCYARACDQGERCYCLHVWRLHDPCYEAIDGDVVFCVARLCDNDTNSDPLLVVASRGYTCWIRARYVTRCVQ